MPPRFDRVAPAPVANVAARYPSGARGDRSRLHRFPPARNSGRAPAPPQMLCAPRRSGHFSSTIPPGGLASERTGNAPPQSRPGVRLLVGLHCARDRHRRADAPRGCRPASASIPLRHPLSPLRNPFPAFSGDRPAAPVGESWLRARPHLKRSAALSYSRPAAAPSCATQSKPLSFFAARAPHRGGSKPTEADSI